MRLSRNYAVLSLLRCLGALQFRSGQLTLRQRGKFPKARDRAQLLLPEPLELCNQLAIT